MGVCRRKNSPNLARFNPFTATDSHQPNYLWHNSGMDVWSEQWDQFQASSRAFTTMQQIALDVAPLIDDVDALEQYARREQLTVNELVYYCNAYEYGGDEGLEAIRNPDIIPADIARHAIRQIDKILTKAGAVPYRLTDEGSAVGVYQIMTRSNGDRYLQPVCQPAPYNEYRPLAFVLDTQV